MDSASSSSAKLHSPNSWPCLCSPTTHPGSFRCKLHRKGGRSRPQAAPPAGSPEPKARSMKGFLMQMLRPSSHDACRRRDFRPRPSRFFLMNGGLGQG